MKTVKEVSELTGVSVRALHHYDAIGLLRPTRVTEAGYRLYDGEALKRLWTILLFRELDFPLAAIRRRFGRGRDLERGARGRKVGCGQRRGCAVQRGVFLRCAGRGGAVDQRRRYSAGQQ